MKTATRSVLVGRALVTRVLLLVGAIVVLYVAWMLLWGVIKSHLVKQGVPEAFLQLYGEVPPLPTANRPVPIRKGNFNGVPIAVPSNYLEFAFEYKDKSIWEPPKPGDRKPGERTFADAVRAFALLVRWPDLRPRNAETEQSYWDGQKPGGQPWLSIALDDDYARSPRPPATPDNGLARRLRGNLERLSAEGLAKVPHYVIDPTDPAGKREIRTWDVRYALRGPDPATGLQWAEPTGPGTERFYMWNQALFWQGDMASIVTDLVKCNNGKMPNPRTYQQCSHRYLLPEWSAYVTVRYPRSWLPQWRDIKARSRDLVRSFQTDSESDAISDQTANPQEE